MITISLSLDDELNAALERICAAKGQQKSILVADLVRQYVDREKLQRALQDPGIVKLYDQMAAEDVALAEEGMADYQRLLHEADRS